ncbi:enoyl-CoA hydratase/isomerase family protein [Chelatococcus asaccharovorans]|uniref:Short chain enoyl-CoA hydratase n=1 Tax=Chelatococcus asaccharovorans TaxID=28210 RepID=A0A2V3U4L1_9HYPH|nr:enoyl-CoA hydratase-related protein [Chelatococcus asaccharovorans]MBS7703722.1 enoyl-CoA hydratase/isomerase family protein [Chelatococcus asaccharovorans]PXW57880.1 short chain enoyl-CoA hydratase [Chelatococcus asaccharovorans]
MKLQLDYRDRVAILTLDGPQTLNALNFAALRAMGPLLDEVAGSAARALIVVGSGPKAFCAGAEIGELRNRSLIDQKRGAELGQDVFDKLASLPVPSIASINGYAFGGGLELALACTFRLLRPNAKLGLPEIKLGLIPGYGGTQRLPRLVGEARALDLIMTGRTIDCAEAERIGLATRVVEGDALEEGLAFAAGFIDYSLPVLGFARAAVQRAAQVSLGDGLRTEAELSTLAYRTADAEEGLAAFAEKRKAVFGDA